MSDSKYAHFNMHLALRYKAILSLSLRFIVSVQLYRPNSHNLGLA